jgi:hypothetical protein
MRQLEGITFHHRDAPRHQHVPMQPSSDSYAAPFYEMCMSSTAERHFGRAKAKRKLFFKSMTPLQNDPQQHQREATNRSFRVPRGGKRSPDSDSVGNLRAATRSRNSCWSTEMRFRRPRLGTTSGVLPVPSGIRASGSGAPRWGHQSVHGSGRVPFSVQQKPHREPPIASAGGEDHFHGSSCSAQPIDWSIFEPTCGPCPGESAIL